MDLNDDLGARLGLAFQQMAGELHAHLAEAGFTDLRQSFGFAFKLLARERLTTSQLAARMGVTHQGAAKTVEDMVAAGYVERVPDPSDGRVRRLVLTERCRALMASAHAFHQEFERRLTERLGPEHVAATRAVLDAIVARSDSRDGLERALPPLA
ncbi:MarR family winged helix-turn-helix transcriptional regulator [Nocardiopsis sp. NPDC050513]|uniref:MarR family winged helix-turn-helix transcriptional regulator n=1 Tax=Nocardiopsis sp. NPDC050513 TaxID=3364338 RepID=UPI0037BC7814